ncbi:hypothetical protein WOLCODRAFT_165981 [Wolfiporia cocos MD-104 SS10]|uniref:Peptidase C14 caspase domain-containing protein n=1 Tax=Wolfiporia cocos (strain MD-104) TaxID=742152 RepID=A0A2H3IYG0_WOLCO|nr:hypothetical protein WOLCODRAFT_165981 [Wolfiporia cocos MD-104 SS10]
MVKYGPRMRTRACCQRKALLIGINYHTDMSPKGTGYDPLRGPHDDVKAFKRLLIEQFAYAEEDVVVMCDGAEEPHLQPTNVNIKHQIRRLVQGAQPGDHFVFLFSGHSDQIVCLEHSEEDGQDEVILPMDHGGLEDRDKLIVDNDIRKLLVDPLPAGAYLTAILDSCHSGTLLDLKHYRCNAIYLPWISNGERRPRSRWENVVRKDATPLTPRKPTPPPALTRVPTLTEVMKTLGWPLRKTSAQLQRSLSLRRTPTEYLDASNETASTKTAVEPPPLPRAYSQPQPPRGKWRGKEEKGEKKTEKSKEKSREKKDKELGKEKLKSLDKNKSKNNSLIKQMSLRLKTAFEIVIPQCTSPTSTVRECDGHCLASPTEKPHVISIAACADRQLDWEDSQGVSMTRALVKQLRRQPNATLAEILTTISYHNYETTYKHRSWRKQWLRCKPKGEVEMGSFPELFEYQDPQLGSQEKLDLGTQFQDYVR